ncbi:proteasome-activating ATPase [Aureococcus anophagefferens]|nr:proteasome-activating ATPase [Aureococcus anophagefferens]
MDDQARQSMAERRSTPRGHRPWRPAPAAAAASSRPGPQGGFAGDYSVMLGGFEDYFEAPLSERGNAATCCGVEHEFGAALLQLPHDLRSVVPGLNFYYDARTDCVRSTKCELIVFGDDVSCDACIGVPNEGEYLENAEVRARIVDLGASSIKKVYLTNAQKDQGQRIFYERSRRLRLALLGRDRRLATAMRKLDTYKQLMVLIATNKLSRVRELFALQLRRGASPHAMIDVFKKAASGLYRPKQYDDEQIAETVLAWRLGAHSLVYALNHSNSAGLASLSTAKDRGKIDAFYACVEDVSHGVDESLLRIRLNLEPLFKKEHVGPKILWHLKIDDVKGDKRLRVDDKDGLIKGCCFHAKHHVSLKINAFSDVVAVRDAIDEGRVHYGTELTVVAIAANRELNYEPHIVALSAGCLNGDPPERTRRIIEQAIEVWVSDLRGQAMRGVLTTVQPDGAASFVKTCHAMFFCKKMTAAHPLHSHLSCLPLFPLWTGDGVTAGCELKHTMKRFVERIKSSTGMTIASFTFTGELLRRLLVGSGLFDARQVDSMFACGPFDAMRVPPKVDLLRAIARISELELGTFGADVRRLVTSCRTDLTLLGHYCATYVTLVADKQPSLGDNMQNVATLQHLAFVLYRRHKTKFIAAQTYRNQQSMLRSLQWSVATAIKENVTAYFLYQDSGDDLENGDEEVDAAAAEEQHEVEDAFATAVAAPAILEKDVRRIKVPVGDGKFKDLSFSAALKFGLEGRGATSESSRIARVRGDAKSGTREVAGPTDDTEATTYHAHEDHFLLLVLTPAGATWAIVYPESFSYASSKSSAVIKSGAFCDKSSKMTCSIVKPKLAGDALVWYHGVDLAERLKDVSTAGAITFNPGIVAEDAAAADEPRDLKLKLSIGVAELETLLHVQYQARGDIDMPTPKSRVVPYLDADDVPLFVAAGSQQAATSIGTRQDSKKDEKIVCGVAGCNQVFTRGKMLQHAGYHIMVKDDIGHGMPCGLCAARPQAQHVVDDEACPGCPAWLEKKKRTLKPCVKCKVGAGSSNAPRVKSRSAGLVRRPPARTFGARAARAAAMADEAPAEAPAAAEEPVVDEATRERLQALDALRGKIREHKEIEAKLKEARLNAKGLIKEFNDTEGALNALQSVGQIIGDVLRRLDEERYIVKASSGPRYVVGCRNKLDKEKLKPGTRVTLDMTTLTIMRALPREVDPTVYHMLNEDPGGISFGEIGGLGEQVVASAIVDKYIGESARVIREMFGFAKDHQPCVIFMDEVDAIGGSRFSEGTSADREIQRTLMELLNQLDGFEQLGQVKMVMATNRPDILDPALLRPGRLDRKIEIPLPNEAARLDILKIHGAHHERRDRLRASASSRTASTAQTCATSAPRRALRHPRGPRLV